MLRFVLALYILMANGIVVKSSIENMTGLEVADVNIRIAGVDMENEKGK